MTMNSNDVLRRLRYIFDYGDTKMMKIFGLGGLDTTRTELSDWLKKDQDPHFQRCSDKNLATFLNGLIVEKRGKKDGPQPQPEQHLTNNIIFRKLKIALKLEAEAVLETLQIAHMKMSKHELSAFFRKTDHKHFRECQDQVLRNFLQGLQQQYRGDGVKPASTEESTTKKTADAPLFVKVKAD